MKALILSILALALTAPTFAATCGGPEAQLKKNKEVFDLFQAGAFDPAASCVGPGYHCRNSGECCGASFCHDGVCSDTSNTCREPGAACRHSGECCGASFCHDGYCSDTNNSCRQEGAHCSNSGECCGALFCHSGFCG